ncbi:MAG: hypothetical protein CL696_03440 [Chloroflexi bacterium]|jgi:sec-independent protein translocase protein TatB|nr:hypothetical protein [Chloroflexota bacterium]|tara:strand:+ start:2732 stop:3052 length:321 start_codon:yes stop_codon:yes gene_type:complete
MNFMGMGIPELGVILLVAFLVLGPGRAIDMARSAGKILGDLRRSFGDVTNAMTMESLEQLPTRNPESSAPAESEPGVPMRAEIPPADEHSDPEPGPDSEPKSEGKG